MSDKKIIGLFAQLANGKDEVANHLVKKLNTEDDGGLYIRDLGLELKPKWSRLGFADAVKHVFMNSFNVTWDFIEEWKRKEEIPPGFDLNVRKSLQHIGDGFRKIQSDIWIRIALRHASRTIISDGRYLNEAKMIKENNGVCVLLYRSGYGNDDPNPSESQIKPYINFCVNNYKDGPILFDIDKWIEHDVLELKYFDYFLCNDGTLEDLYAKVDNKLIPYLKEKGII